MEVEAEEKETTGTPPPEQMAERKREQMFYQIVSEKLLETWEMEGLMLKIRRKESHSWKQG